MQLNFEWFLTENKYMATYKPENCPISKFVEILGDGWSWLILREAFRGSSRFSDFQFETGIAKNILGLAVFFVQTNFNPGIMDFNIQPMIQICHVH